jgi:hypothetical protein
LEAEKYNSKSQTTYFLVFFEQYGARAQNDAVIGELSVVRSWRNPVSKWLEHSQLNRLGFKEMVPLDCTAIYLVGLPTFYLKG